MATAGMTEVVRRLRRAALREQSDSQLLADFVAARDEAAFEALVRRHGPLVLGVCARVTRDHHDAEDAFQATFLVLARKAACVRPAERLAGWLWGVAYRAATRARCLAAKRRAREAPVAVLPERPAPAGREPLEVGPVLDEELNRLPEKYRLPVLLCELQGRPRREVAGALGVPEGTLSSRLATARKLLAGRLARRGLALSAAALSPAAALAGVPARLFASVRSAAGPSGGAVLSANAQLLAEGVIHAMSVSKVKVGTVVLLLAGLVGLGGGLSTTGATREARGERPAVRTEAAEGRERLPVLTGTIKAIGADSITLRYGRRGEKDKEESFTLSNDVEVYRGREKVDRAAAKAGAAVTLQFNRDRTEVVRISLVVPRPTRVGRVKAIDTGKGELTLTTWADRRSKGKDELFKIGADTKAYRGREEAALADVKPGLPVSVVLKEGTNEVVAIHLGVEREGRPRPVVPTVSGTIKSFDAGKRLLTVTVPQRREAPKEESFTLAKDAKIWVGRTEGKLADLGAGVFATLELDKERKQVLRVGIIRPRPSRSGQVKAIDLEKRQLTIAVVKDRRTREVTEEVLPFHKDAKITIGRQKVTWDDVKVGRWVSLRLSEDGKVVEWIGVTLPRQTVPATVKSTNAGKNELTVTIERRGEAEEERVIALGKDIKITVDARPAKLADLKAGNRVWLHLVGEEGKQVELVRAGEQPVFGQVKSIDVAGGKLTLSVRREEKEYKVGPGTRVTIDGKPAKLAGLAVDDEVAGTLSVDGVTLLTVRKGDLRGRRE
jgi:RNA polymerase sigma factor (sigma-70 family)